MSALEREIDQLVYALYGLTPEEIQNCGGRSQMRRILISTRAQTNEPLDRQRVKIQGIREGISSL